MYGTAAAGAGRRCGEDELGEHRELHRAYGEARLRAGHAQDLQARAAEAVPLSPGGQADIPRHARAVARRDARRLHGPHGQRQHLGGEQLSRVSRRAGVPADEAAAAAREQRPAGDNARGVSAYARARPGGRERAGLPADEGLRLRRDNGAGAALRDGGGRRRRKGGRAELRRAAG